MESVASNKKNNTMHVFLKITVIFAVFLAFFASFLPNSKAFADELNNTYVVTANSAVVFEQANFSSKKLTTLKNKTEILLTMNGQKPQKFENGGWIFYKTETTFQTEGEQIAGFILAELVTPKQAVIVSIPHFNAKTNMKCNVFFRENENFVKQENLVLEKGTQVFLYEGFESKSNFTAICFVKDNQVLYGFLETKNINPNGINPIVITCTCLILALLGIIFAWLFMKNKKAKKTKV